MPTGFDLKSPKYSVQISSGESLLENNQSLVASMKAAQGLEPYLPFGPLSDAADLSILLDEPLQSAASELITQQGEIDALQQKLIESSNTLTALKEACEEQLSQTRDQATSLALIQQDQSTRQYWYVETFDNPFKTDQSATTCLVDTTYSFCSLGIVRNEPLGDITYSIDRQSSIGLPGANLVLSSKGLRGANVSPVPMFEQDISPRNNFGSLNDGDSSTILEWERNFIYSPQAVAVIGHSLGPLVSMDNATTSVEPLAKTKYDWSLYVQWPGESDVDQGPSNKGYPLGEFVPPPNARSLALGQGQNQCFLTLKATLSTPQPLSMIVLTPVIYGNARPIVNKLEVSSDGMTWILIGKNDSLGERALSASEQKRVSDLKKGTGSAVYMIPTNRPISQVRITLTGARYVPKEGFGHKFTVVYKHERVDNSAAWGLISWASNSYWWERCPSDNIPVNKVSRSTSIFSGIAGALGVAGAVTKALSPTPKAPKVEVYNIGTKDTPVLSTIPTTPVVSTPTGNFAVDSQDTTSGYVPDAMRMQPVSNYIPSPIVEEPKPAPEPIKPAGFLSGDLTSGSQNTDPSNWLITEEIK